MADGDAARCGARWMRKALAEGAAEQEMGCKSGGNDGDGHGKMYMYMYIYIHILICIRYIRYIKYNVI